MNFLTIDGTQVDSSEEAIRTCGNLLLKKNIVDEKYIEACVSREKEFATGLPVYPPVAIPHTLDGTINESALCYLRLKVPVTFYQMDTQVDKLEVKHVFCMALKESSEHLDFLQKIISCVQSSEFIEKLEGAKGDEMLDILINEFEG